MTQLSLALSPDCVVPIHRHPSAHTLAELLRRPDLITPPEPIVPRLVYSGRTTMLAGKEKLGKSTFATAVMASVSGGKSFLNETLIPGRVLFLGLDEHLGESVRRFARFRAIPEMIHVADPIEGRKPVEVLDDMVREIRPRLVVVDALANFADLYGIQDPSSSAAWTPLLVGINRIARDSETGILVVHHARKSDGKYRDSSAIGATLDAALEFREGREGNERKIRGRARWPTEDFSVRLVGDIKSEHSWLSYQLSDGDGPLHVRVLHFVRETPGCSLRKVREGVGGRYEYVDKALDVLIETGEVEDRGDGRHRAYCACQ